MDLDETSVIMDAKGVSKALESALKYEAEGYDFFRSTLRS